MTTLPKAIISTAEASELCGKAVIFEELLAIYPTLLKPIRTLANGLQNWSTEVVIAAIRKAQAEGALLDRPKVELALLQLRARTSAAKTVKPREAHS
jgi:hypothetical protein